MNKLLRKIAGVALGLTMAIGVGVSIGASSKEAFPVRAAETEGTTQTLTITRDSFGSGSGYSVAEFSQSTTGGTSISGFGQIYLTTTASMQFNKGQGMGAIYNTVAIPGRITSISAKTASGTNRAWNAWVSSTAYSHSGTTLSAGSNATKLNNSAVTVTTSQTTIGTSTHGYSYFALIENVNNASYLANVTITYEVPKTITFDGIELSGTYPTTFTQGDTFSHDGMTVTAKYTGQDDVDVTSSATFSGYNMSTTGNQTVTVSYTDTTLSVTKTATYSITVNAPKAVSSFAITNNPMPENNIIEVDGTGETSITGDATWYLLAFNDSTYGTASVHWSSTSGLTYDHVNFEDADGGYVEPTFTMNGTYTLTLSYTGVSSLTMTYSVGGFPNYTYVTDTIDNALTGRGTETTYAEWSGKTDQSDAIYAGQSAGQHSTVQLRSNNSNSGVITTASGGVVSSITIKFNTNSADTRQVDVYGKSTAYSAATDLYNTSTRGTKIGDATYDGTETDYTIVPDADYQYVGFRSNSGALYLDAIEITWKVEQEIIDTLNSIEFGSAAPTKTTYVVGQTITFDGLEVYGNYTTAGSVLLNGKSGLTITANPTTANATGTLPVTFTATYVDGDVSKSNTKTVDMTVSADSVTKLEWGTRGYDDGDYFLSGTTIGSNIATSSWTFTPTWASGLDKGTPTFGTGDENVHVGLYTSPAPESEGTALTASYQFTTADDGKYLVACYKGKFSTNNKQLFITESLNSIIEPASGEAGWYLIRDAANLVAGDTVAIVTAEANSTSGSYYAMSTTQNTNNRGAEVVTVAEDEMTINDNVQQFTLEVGTTSDTWSFNTGSGYIYAASSSSNHLKTETDKSANSSFTVSITNSTGVAALTAQGTNSRNQLKFNYNNGSPMFSCYGSGQSAVAIYKYSEPMDKEIADTNLKVQHVVVEYAKDFSSRLETICVSYGSTDITDLKNEWSDLADQFDNWIKNGDKNLEGDEITLALSMFANADSVDKEQVSTADSLQNMLAKYDWIVSHYKSDCTDFLYSEAGRGEVQSASGRIVIDLLNNDMGSTTAIIIIVSLASLTAIGGYFFIRKRKEQ